MTSRISLQKNNIKFNNYGKEQALRRRTQIGSRQE